MERKIFKTTVGGRETLGVCRKSIFNIEHNNVIPNIDTCLRLAKYLDMTVEELFEIQDA